MSTANTPELALQRKDGKIRSHVRQKWLVETPEERVRQAYLPVLVNEYGFKLDQMAEERKSRAGGPASPGRFRHLAHGSGQGGQQNPADHRGVQVGQRDDPAGGLRPGRQLRPLANAPFFVTHNHRETRFWRVRKDRMPGSLEEIENIPHADASDKEIEELIAKLKTFKEDEFAELLHQCHNVIRNREKLDPAAAFDEIAKILFVKVYVERELKRKRRRKNLFTVEYLDEQLGDDPLDDLFDQTKQYLHGTIFDDDDDQSEAGDRPGNRRKLERYNLPTPAKTSRASPSNVSWAGPSAAKSASSSRPAPSLSSWFEWWIPRKATSSAIRPAGPAAS